MPLARQLRHRQHISRLPHQPYPTFLEVKTIPPPKTQSRKRKENRIVKSYCLLLAHRSKACEIRRRQVKG